MSEKLADHAELLDVWYPGTLAGIADRVWEINCLISDLRKEREPLEQILLAWSVHRHNEAEERFRVGAVIEGKIAPPVRAVWRMKEGLRQGKPVFEPKLEFERKK